VAHQALRRASLVFFFVYVALLIVAGAWGIVGARVDMWLLLRLHTNDLPHRTAANLLSQYRFLRAIALGFGVFALTHWRRIYAVRSYNRLFLAVMAAGVAARLLSLGLDGTTSWWMYLFLGWELVSVALIFLATRSGLTGA
jgi:hypothetical protein